MFSLRRVVMFEIIFILFHCLDPLRKVKEKIYWHQKNVHPNKKDFEILDVHFLENIWKMRNRAFCRYVEIISEVILTHQKEKKIKQSGGILLSETNITNWSFLPQYDSLEQSYFLRPMWQSLAILLLEANMRVLSNLTSWDQCGSLE